MAGLSLTLGPANVETSIYAMVRRKCKVDPTIPDSYTSDAIITQYANEELVNIASECRSIKKSNYDSPLATVQGQRTYNFPDDCLEVTDVFLGPTGAAIRINYNSSEGLYNTFGPGWNIRQGQPFYWYTDFDSTLQKYTLAFCMVPPVTGQVILLEYILKPQILAVNADVAQIDPRLDWALVYRIASKIMHDKRDTAFAEIYAQSAQDIIKKYNESGRKSPMPLDALNTSRGPNSWEMY